MKAVLVRGKYLQANSVQVSPWLIAPASLFALALILLVTKIGGHPGFIYNWEEYTARDTLQFWSRPGWGIFEIRNGLMTNSGDSPFIALPVWIGYKIGGVGLTSMRLPVALLAATAVPVLWLFARRVAGVYVATLAAALLLLSPVFLLYGRTATLVGLSTSLALATLYVLLRVLERPASWQWLIGLQICLLAGVYAYAPIRFLWLISLALLAYEFITRISDRKHLTRAIIVTAIALPVFLSLGSLSDPGTAIGKYYYARGEQVISLSSRTEGYRFYLDDIERNDIAATQEASSAELALRLIGQNTVDLGNLMTDFDTDPILLRHWRPEGRFYPWFLVPFFVIGFVRSLKRLRSSLPDRLLVTAFAGFTLPLILTSKVHAGRMIFALPILCIFIAAGFVWLIGLLQSRFGSRFDIRVAAVLLTVLLLGSVAVSSWRDYRTAPSPTREAQVVNALAEGLDDIRQRGGAGVLLLEDFDSFNELDIADYQLTFMDSIQFQDGRSEDPDEFTLPEASKVAVIYGLEAADLSTVEPVADMCRNVYFVDEHVLNEFQEVRQEISAGCDDMPIYWVLQGSSPAIGPLSGLAP